MSQSPKAPSTLYTYGFVTALCFVCALILSLLASLLSVPQQQAEVLDRSKQMLMSAKILHPNGYFLIQSEDGYAPARHQGEGVLVAGSEEDIAQASDILQVFDRRIKSVLIDGNGKITSFEEAGINEDEYLSDHEKTGYYQLPLKLAYRINANPTGADRGGVDGYIVPVNGMGLWDRIYGYLALKPDGMTVIGIAWYKHAETPGLGANIAETKWQDQFTGKQIFQPDPEGNVDLTQSPVGIEVRRGKVADELGSSPKARSAVDGMAGATLTGVGVTKAYKDSLEPYRPFLMKINTESMN